MMTGVLLTGVALAADLHLQAVDAFGREVEATWTLESGELLKQGLNDVPVGNYRMAVTAEGFFGETVELTVRPDMKAEVQAVLYASLVTLTDRRLIIHDKIHFETNLAVIKPESFELLNMIARTLVEHPEVLGVRIEGHADERGGDDFNLDLSHRRAESVRQYLIRAGVGPDRLSAKGFGEERPLNEESNEEAWAANRRVEFHITDRLD
jgi:OmpA-OmpF porin, OOP family